MVERKTIKIGRGHDADIRVTDISVSRFHAKINRSDDGHFYLEDNRSKFGTLIQIRKPFKIERHKTNYIQCGRSLLQLRIDDQSDHEEEEAHEKTLCEILCCIQPKNKKRRKETKL